MGLSETQSIRVNVTEFPAGSFEPPRLSKAANVYLAACTHKNLSCAGNSILWFRPHHHRFFRCNTPKECR
jgi:hypothetical protein